MYVGLSRSDHPRLFLVIKTSLKKRGLGTINTVQGSTHSTLKKIKMAPSPEFPHKLLGQKPKSQNPLLLAQTRTVLSSNLLAEIPNRLKYSNLVYGPIFYSHGRSANFSINDIQKSMKKKMAQCVQNFIIEAEKIPHTADTESLKQYG